jgi:hypothetical protein
MTAFAIFAGMTLNTDTQSSNQPNGEPREAPTLRIVTETPESSPLIPPLPAPPVRPRQHNPPPAHPWDLLWFW